MCASMPTPDNDINTIPMIGMSLTQSELANKLNIPTSTYANWELGRTEPSIADIFNLIDFFEIEANDLFDID